MKPTIKINPDSEQDNIYYVLGYASGSLLSLNGSEGWNAVFEMRRRMMDSRSYDEAIKIIKEYVNIEWEGGVPM